MKHEYTDGVVNDLRNGHWPKKTKNLQENWMLRQFKWWNGEYWGANKRFQLWRTSEFRCKLLLPTIVNYCKLLLTIVAHSTFTAKRIRGETIAYCSFQLGKAIKKMHEK